MQFCFTYTRKIYFFCPLHQKWHSIPPTLQDLILQQPISVQLFQSSEDYKVRYLTQSQNNRLFNKTYPFSPPSSYWFSAECSTYQNLRTNSYFLLWGSNLRIAEFEFWLAAHWAPDLSAPNFTKISEELTDWYSVLPGGGLGPMCLNPATLTSRPRIYGNSVHPTSSER